MDSSIHGEPHLLMQRAKAGDTSAFGELYELYFVPIYRYIYFRVRNRVDTEDLTQVVFMKVFSAVHRFEEYGKSPLAYFFTVARNTIINHWRKKKEVPLEESEGVVASLASSEPHPGEQAQQREAFTAATRAIGALTDEQQEVIIMKFINELSNVEIAQVLGKSEEAVRQLQSRGLRVLRTRISK